MSTGADNTTTKSVWLPEHESWIEWSTGKVAATGVQQHVYTLGEVRSPTKNVPWNVPVTVCCYCVAIVFHVFFMYCYCATKRCSDVLRLC